MYFIITSLIIRWLRLMHPKWERNAATMCVIRSDEMTQIKIISYRICMYQQSFLHIWNSNLEGWAAEECSWGRDRHTSDNCNKKHSIPFIYASEKPELLSGNPWFRWDPPTIWARSDGRPPKILSPWWVIMFYVKCCDCYYINYI